MAATEEETTRIIREMLKDVIRQALPSYLKELPEGWEELIKGRG